MQLCKMPASTLDQNYGCSSNQLLLDGTTNYQSLQSKALLDQYLNKRPRSTGRTSGWFGARNQSRVKMARPNTTMLAASPMVRDAVPLPGQVLYQSRKANIVHAGFHIKKKAIQSGQTFMTSDLQQLVKRDELNQMLHHSDSEGDS